MKILLLSDIPPCDNLTAGLVLSAMVRFLPRGSVCCFVVANPTLDIRMTPEFANIPTRFHAKPNENWSWLPQRRLVRKLSSAISFTGEMLTEKRTVRSLIEKAITFGCEQKVDRVWAVLQGQTTIRMAKAVADGLGVPLHTHVWDPFSWWAKANCLDGMTTRHVQHLFDDAIRNSVSVATASEPMAEHYRQRFHVTAKPVISSHSKNMAQTPEIQSGVGSPLLIGMAGQFYAASEWLELLKALEKANWTIGGRPVRVVVMGPQRPPGEPKSHVAFLGWKSQPDAAFILSLCDILYCPYPFDPSMKEVSQFSFPSKLVLYLAAGRPIVFHGPEYASPARYIKTKKCGLVADRLVATAIFNEIERLTFDPAAYAEMAANAQAAFRDDFTLESMERSFHAFIGADPHEGDAIMYDHTKHEEAVFTPPQLSTEERRRSFAWLARRCAKGARDRMIYEKRRLKPIVRYFAFKIPRLYSLHHEIHSLYAEKEVLKRIILRLEEENTQLRALLCSKPVAADIALPPEANVELEAVLSANFTTSPEAVFEKFPRDKTLVLTGEQDRMTSVFASGDGNSSALSHVTVAMIGYVSAPVVFPRNIERTDNWQAVKNTLPKEAVGHLLRLVLQEGYERLVVEDGDRNRLALAIAVANLASIRTALITSRQGSLDGVAWAANQADLDVIEILAPGTGDSVRLDVTASNVYCAANDIGLP